MGELIDVLRLSVETVGLREHVAVNACVRVMLTYLDVDLHHHISKGMSVINEPITLQCFCFWRSETKHNECCGGSDSEF